MIYYILSSLVANPKLLCQRNVQSLSHRLLALQVEGKAMHPFSDSMELLSLSLSKEVSLEFGISGYSFFVTFN